MGLSATNICWIETKDLEPKYAIDVYPTWYNSGFRVWQITHHLDLIKANNYNATQTEQLAFKCKV
jgi:hypothetical protein